jgi:hypothetical protein
MCMLTRQLTGGELDKAKATLSRKGYNQREASRELKVTPWHLNKVLRGHRESRRLLRAINALPAREEQP